MSTSPVASTTDDELESLVQDNKGYLPQGRAFITHGQLQGLFARLRAAEKDAARYRWLRDEALHVSTESPAVVVADEFGNQCEGILYEQFLDRAIDGAMEQQP